ncbi:MAG: type II toxin-antitoxin system mRNA interferase toxin, RelE/StbE family [Candidatus Omnitrophica bacterium]|nr:type II toxin-antitoxin system mRNA interferase toxin, RelE/StbE family [Candidatus Omnitrophota bacterium]
MASYRLRLSDQAERVLARMAQREPVVFMRVVRALDELEQDPSLGKALVGKLRGRRSYRVGSYRIIYTVQRQQLLVLMIDIGHRRGIYR